MLSDTGSSQMSNVLKNVYLTFACILIFMKIFPKSTPLVRLQNPLAAGYRTLLSLHVDDNYEEKIAYKLLEETRDT